MSPVYSCCSCICCLLFQSLRENNYAAGSPIQNLCTASIFQAATTSSFTRYGFQKRFSSLLFIMCGHLKVGGPSLFTPLGKTLHWTASCMKRLYHAVIVVDLQPVSRISSPDGESTSVNGSSAAGHCSNSVPIAGNRVCREPASSILLDGNIPTLTGLDGDMWASQLLTLQKSSQSFIEINFELHHHQGFSESGELWWCYSTVQSGELQWRA